MREIRGVPAVRGQAALERGMTITGSKRENLKEEGGTQREREKKIPGRRRGRRVRERERGEIVESVGVWEQN